jgi:triosephosphate isomerase
MQRQKFVAGNWKMFSTAESARALAAGVARGLGEEGRVAVAVFPPFPYLGVVGEALRGSRVLLGAQNCYVAKEGAFTGEVSPAMLVDVGCRYVILGHSERRHVLGETDDLINRKVKLALATGLHVIFCVGEKEEQRRAAQTEAVLDRQLTAGLAGVPADAAGRLVLAYEPVWAIGTGQNATPEQARQAHAFLRRRFADLFGRPAADALLIQYGGSVKPDNAASLLSQPDVDGALVGGASLQADSFLAIARAGIV